MRSSTSIICLAMLVAAGSGFGAMGGPIGRTLTPEEHVLYLQEQHGANWRTLTPQQRCERQQQIQRVWSSMSPADIERLREQLDARWNALPAVQKQRLEQRIQQRVAMRRQRHMMAPAPGTRGCAGANGAPL